MAHFALLNQDDMVIDVTVINDEDILDKDGKENEEIGIKLCNSLKPGKWIQTSFNKKFRKNFAEIGGSYYDKSRDAFMYKQPYPSWILDENTCTWHSPVPNKYEDYIKEYRSLGATAIWDENEKMWIYHGLKIYSKQDLINFITNPSGQIANPQYLDCTGIYPGD